LHISGSGTFVTEAFLRAYQRSAFLLGLIVLPDCPYTALVSNLSIGSQSGTPPPPPTLFHLAAVSAMAGPCRHTY